MINPTAPARNPTSANQPIFFKYQTKSIFSIPIATTPAAEPIINILPPVPAAGPARRLEPGQGMGAPGRGRPGPPRAL